MFILELLDYIKVKFIQSSNRRPFLVVISKTFDKLTSVNWYISSLGKKHRNKIQSLHNKFHGERCFIIGNGPSLKKMDLRLLRKEYTFGLNRFYLLKENCGFYPNFLVSVNPLVLKQFYKDIKRVPGYKFIQWKSRSLFRNARNTIFLKSLIEQKFTRDITKGVWEGATVTYVAIQLARYMGFTEVILVGVDHNFKTQGRPHKKIKSKKNDVDHFDKSYFGRGFEWNLPDLVTSERAYRMAKKAFEEDGLKIYDATVGGKLHVFKKISYSDLFK